LIQEIKEGPIHAPSARVIQARGGSTLMPGLIDAHVHVNASGLDLARVARTPQSYLAHWAAAFLAGTLDRGFTTVRDVGGADAGLAAALRDGLLPGPRLFYGGRVISQTGGHGDFRPGDLDLDHIPCGCAGHCDGFSVIADGVDAVRKAVREECRRGAAHIKIMASGGVSSPTDSLERCQYSDDEIAAAVDEATRAGIYVAAHCHPAEAIRRAAQLGVRTIEHGTLIDAETARIVAETGAFVVPTLAIIAALDSEGEAMGFPPPMMAKLRMLTGAVLEGLQTMRSAGVQMGFGTDLLGELQDRQSSEFLLRAQVLPAIDILRSATSINARLLGQEGRLGCLAPGAVADILLVAGDPLGDISLLARPETALVTIVQGGRIHRMREPD